MLWLLSLWILEGVAKILPYFFRRFTISCWYGLMDTSAMFCRKPCNSRVDVLTELSALIVGTGTRKRTGKASSSSTSTQRPLRRSETIARFTHDKILSIDSERDNSSSLSKPPTKDPPSAQTIISGNPPFLRHSGGVLMPFHQHSPECEVSLLLDFARITD